MRLVDSHCHLDDPRFAPDLEQVLQRAAEAGVEAAVTVGTHPASWERALALAEASRSGPSLYVALGLHPHEAGQAGPEVWRRLEGRLPQAVAVGEIGLDFHYHHAPPEVQEEAFEAQLDLARRFGRPVILHVRDAAQQVLAILRHSGIDRGVWHCFSGDWEVAKEALALGLHLGFGGLVTFQKGVEGLQDAARRCPLDRILLETDAPYLAPHPWRGRRNEPALVAAVASRLASLRGEDPEALAEATAANARRLFGLQAP